MDGLSIGILSHSGKEVLEDCIRSILRYKPFINNLDIFIVNNGSEDGSEIDCSNKYKLRLVNAHNKDHFIGGLNAVFKHAAYENVLFTSNDVFFRKNSIGAIHQYLNDFPWSIVQPVFYDMEGQVQNAGMSLKWPGYGLAWKEVKSHLPYHSPIVTTTAIAMTQSTFRVIGHFDKAFDPAFYEDTDYSMRARKQGVWTMVLPRARANHIASHTFSQTEGAKRLSRICHRNRQVLVKKHFSGLDKWLRLAAINTIDPLYHLTVKPLFNVAEKSFGIVTPRW